MAGCGEASGIRGRVIPLLEDEQGITHRWRGPAGPLAKASNTSW